MKKAFILVLITFSLIFLGCIQLPGWERHNECSSLAKMELNEFRINLEETASYKSDTNFDFNINKRSCFNESDTTIKIEKLVDTNQCGYICGRATKNCFVLVLDNLTGSEHINNCLNLPTYASFVKDTNKCPNIFENGDLYEILQNGDENNLFLTSGKYLLKNIAPVGKTYPQMCVYRKTDQ
jgi:hypothetical protein